MKKLLSFLTFSILCLTMMQAQTTPLTVDGFVFDTNGPVPHWPVIIEVPSAGISDTVLTDSLGYFTYFKTINSTQGSFSVTVYDCNGLANTQPNGFSPGTTQFTFAFAICQFTNPGPCQSGFFLSQGSNGQVSFFENTTGGTPFLPLTYQWWFGDGNTSAQANPSHTYTQNGTYNVCLIVLDNTPGSGCTDTFCQNVTITNVGGGGQASCSVNFNIVPVPGAIGTLQFLANGTSSNGQPFTFWNWDFGDGTTSTLQNPIHVFQPNQIYNVCLYGGNAQCADSFCLTVQVNGGTGTNGCHADFTFFSSQNGTVNFHDQSTSSLTPINSWSWDFGDGNTSNLPNPSHIYAANGTYNVCLIAASDSCSDTICHPVHVTNIGVTPGVPCVADFIASPDSNGGVAFTNLSSPTTPLFPNVYLWTFGDGDSSGATDPYHTYAAPGSYTVCLNMFTFDPNTGNVCTADTCMTIQVTGTANCIADFSALTNPASAGVYTFTDQSSSNVGAITSWSWDFGDGNSSAVQNPVHTYTQNGTYQVCLTIGNNNGCVATSCTTLHVTGIGGTGTNCTADFSAAPLLNGQVNFTNLSSPQQSGGGLLAFQWDFGDGNSYHGFDTLYTYAANGTYTACLYMLYLDPTTGGICTDSICSTITITNAGGGNPGVCVADFTPQVLVGGVVNFTNNSIPSTPNAPVSYFWDFGDGNTSTATNPSHIYTTNGTFIVCLVMTESSITGTCSDTLCGPVFIQGAGPGNKIAGTVGTNNPANQINNGMVFLYQWNTGTNGLTVIDSTAILASSFTFNNIPNGSYMVQATLTPASPFYNSYMPTYSGNTSVWSGASSMTMSGTTNSNVSIVLSSAINPGGPGSIGGNITQGYSKNGPGDPVGNVHVLLMDLNDNGVAHTVTNTNGEFLLANLPYGTYKVHAEITGLPTIDQIVTINASSSIINDVNFEVNSDGITTSIEELIFESSVSIYPNPASDRINLNWEMKESGAVSIKVVDIFGKQIYAVDQNFFKGSQETTLPLIDVTPGVYFLNISTKEEALNFKFIKE